MDFRMFTIQRYKTPTPAAQAPFETEEAKYPFNKLSWDILGPLQLTIQGNKCAGCHRLFYQVFAPKITDSKTLPRVLADKQICRYGMSFTLYTQ